MASEHKVPEKKCQECDATYKAHRWGNSKAQKEGWFMQRDGRSYCPEHVPGWVAGWRARNARRAQSDR